jgi:putative transposase
VLKREGITISMDGKGRATDNILIERVWRSLKYEDVSLRDYQTLEEARAGIGKWFWFYNLRRPHQSLDNRTPMEVYTGVHQLRWAAA